MPGLRLTFLFKRINKATVISMSAGRQKTICVSVNFGSSLCIIYYSLEKKV